MTSPLEQLASQLLDKHLSFIPILPGEKRPGAYIRGAWGGFNDWAQYAERMPTLIETAEWCGWPNAGVGLVTGKVSGVVALDFDTNMHLLSDHIKDLTFSCKKIGARGFTSFFKFNGETNRKWIYNNETVLELLSTGRQTVLPPTMHPNGSPYCWENGKTLLNIDLVELPDLPADFCARMDNLFSQPKPTATAAAGINLFELREALKFIPADNYDLWIKIGMGLRASLGDAGFEVWNQWSQNSEKYKENEMPRKWHSFANCSKISVASIFYEAQQRGFNAQPKAQVKPQPKRQFLTPQIVSTAPGLVGQLAHWINENSIYQQPELALAASLAAVGCLKGHRVRGETNLRTNILTVGIAPSGAGKSRAMDLIEELFAAAGVDFLFGGRPKSDAGLLKMLAAGHGRKMINWDELGISLSEMTSSKAQVHKSGILQRVMDLFSKAGSVYRGDEYANHDGKQERQDIDQPCLCVYGASTPVRFFEALSTTHAVDGFAARWLVFESLTPFPKRREVGQLSIPADLIRAVQDIQRQTTNVTDKGNISRAVEIVPAIVKFTPEARLELNRIWDDFDIRRESAKSESAQSVWARAAEHLQKICLICESGYGEISLITLSWARDLVIACMDYTCKVLESRVSDNDTQKSLNKVLAIISASPGLSNSELIRRTQWLKRTERNDIIGTLEASCQISVDVRQNSTKKITTFTAL